MDPRESVGTVVEWIHATCKTYPDAVATMGIGESLTFSKLWERATNLAGELIDSGVLPEDRVGIWAVQSSDFVTSVLAVMLSGAAYVPLDPTYPKERLDYIVANAEVRLIVVPDDATEVVSALHTTAMRVSTSSPGSSSDREWPLLGPNNAAYVIYTSGSTGRPKGVVIEHHAVISLLQWLIDEFQPSPGDRVMGTATLAFDTSVPNYLLPLVSGATFVALEAESAKDPQILVQAIERYRPRMMELSSTMLRMLSEIGWAGDPELDIWGGGERISAAAIRHLGGRVRSLCNFYGPTETTVEVTFARLGPDDLDSPIGFAPAHMRCFLLDASQSPTPNGEVGELFIAGPQLARGYLNNPALTDERFVMIDPGDGTKIRSYRTGDLAMFKSDGSLLFVGRTDDQVKIRGYRIELGEIEQRIVKFPGVRDAVVLPHQAGENDDPRLAAFLCTDKRIAPRDLREFAKKILPDYMVPSFFIEVDEFPLTPTGKVDRRRLAEMDLNQMSSHEEATERAAPDNELEAALLGVVAGVLEVDESTLGVDDDFFDHGGTSLRCMRLFMKIEENYAVTLPISTMVNAPTVRLLSSVVASSLARKDAGVTVVKSPYDWEWVLSILWSEILGNRRVEPSNDFFALGGTDDDARRMLEQLRIIYATTATVAELHQAPTIKQFAALTRGRSTRSSLVPIDTTGDRTPFFCIAGPGGLALSFLPLSRMLGPDQPLYGLQSHGVERRGFPDITFSRAAARYVRLIREVQPEGPYLIGGHSLGGLIALKVAQRLEDAGEEVALLAIFDTILPPRLAGVARVGGVSVSKSGDGLTRSRRRRWITDIGRTLRLPFTGLVRWRGTTQYETFEFHARVQSKFTRRLRPWRGRAIVFVSGGDRSGSVEESWAHLLEGKWASVSISGDHTGILQRPHVVRLAPRLREEIDDALHTKTPSSW